ncbi:microtubule-associated tumor suppressor 1 homolog A isoform X2 [Kryptolebias marmoratus]|uniref:Microtubule-associated tumor suppressor 1 homolog n=1 Tax=Kryptolebias marmoratus TaxID=37003 RepID=A0A3Q3AV48_KRYMA|nr:microtubule-associated tumor suppressor 1 homolog A isoform X2 [Kryptolebias marmoratus]
MSKKTFLLPSDPFESSFTSPHSTRQSGLSSESRRMSASPDTSSISSPSEREARSSPYIDMECCFDESICACDVPEPAVVQGDLLSVVSSKMDETFIVTPVNSGRNFWNESLRCFHSEQAKPETCRSFSEHAEDEGDGEAASPDFAGSEFRLSKRSSENDGCSLSSGEMLIRSNSFCREELSLVAVSSLEDSDISPAASRLSFPAEFTLPSTTRPDVSKTSGERAHDENAGHPRLCVTFTQADSLELLIEGVDAASPGCGVALPSESEGGLWKTFICEMSPDLTNDANAGAGSLLRVSEFTPEHGKTFVHSTSAIQESDDGDDIHTSTPVQNLENKMPPLPSLSPCIERSSRPGQQLVKKQPICVTPGTGLTPSLCKVKRAETPKFPTSDLSGAKSKVLSKASHQAAIPGPSPRESEQANLSDKQTGGNNKTGIRIIPAKVMTKALSATTKMLHKFHGKVNTSAANLKVRQSCGLTVVDGRAKARAASLDLHPAVNEPASAVGSAEGSFEKKQAALGQTSDASEHAGSQGYASSLEKSPTRSGQAAAKPTPKKHVSNKIGVGSGLASGRDKPCTSKARSRCSSEGLTSKPPKEKRATLRVATSFILPKTGSHKDSTKPGKPDYPPQNKQVEEATNSPRDVKKISLVAESRKSASAGAPSDESESRPQRGPSFRQGKGGSLSQPPAACPRPTPLSVRQRRGTFERADAFRVSRTEGKPQFQQKHDAGSQRAQAADAKPHLDGTRPPQTPTRPSLLMGPPLTPASRIPRKTPGPSRSRNEGGDPSELGQSTKSTSVSGGSAHKPTPVKPPVVKARLISTPGRNIGPALTPACKPASSASKTASPVKIHTAGRTAGPTLSRFVDKNKSKAGSCQQKPQWQPTQSSGPRPAGQAGVPQDGRKAQSVQQLQQLLTESHRRFQATVIVLQQVLAERDEATRTCRELSQELVNLQGELACSVHSSERLEREKEELRAALQDASQSLWDQHRQALAELEHRLQAAYQAEWDKAHLTCQEEADRCRALLQQQMEELKASHETVKLKLEMSHEEQLQRIKQQHEMSLEELRKVHAQELEGFSKTSKDAEAALYRELQELTVENNALTDKLAAEERRRKELAENTHKDSHALYLEQELESLKVVLDLKTEQLHQQEKKLMEVNKLTEKNVKLEESLIKVQQENEDLKARMEKHAALSRQLSTEQAVLQESLQKESKVNKRLSMENEELLWKLHNGDLSSPQKVSPISTSPSFKLQPPRSSAFFSSPPVSPR